jgi:hypothetical protein
MFTNKYKLMWEGLKEYLYKGRTFNYLTDEELHGKEQAFQCKIAELEKKYQCYTDNEYQNRFEKQENDITELFNIFSEIKRMLDDKGF